MRKTSDKKIHLKIFTIRKAPEKRPTRPVKIRQNYSAKNHGQGHMYYENASVFITIYMFFGNKPYNLTPK